MWLRRRNSTPVDAHLARGGFDKPFHVVVALGPAGAAIGAHRGGVGEQAFGRDLDQRRGIDADDVFHCVMVGGMVVALLSQAPRLP